jgi:alcohol dehydrogenase class IV
MPYVLVHNAPAIRERLAALARYLDLPGQKAESVVEWILALRKQIGIPHTLKEIGFDTDVVAQAAPMAEKDPSTGGNPVPLKAKDYDKLYRAAIAGILDA